MRIVVSVAVITSFFLLISCAPRIEGYTRGDCLTDPATGTCRQVCSWKLSYRLRSKTDCMRAKYDCPKGEYLFGNRSGCGCARPVFCEKQ